MSLTVVSEQGPLSGLAAELQAEVSKKPTFLEYRNVAVVRAQAAVGTRIGLTTAAMRRGKDLAKAIKPELADQMALKINISHAKGLVRCNNYIAQERAKTAALHEQYQQLLVALGLQDAQGATIDQNERLPA